MKHLFYWVLALGLGTAHAQTGNVQITWGDYVPLAKGHTPVGFAGNETIGYVQVGQNPGSGIVLNKISPALKGEGTDAKELKDLKRSFVERVVTLGDKTYVMVSAFDKETKSDFLMAYEMDMRSGKFAGEGKRLITAPGETDASSSTFIPGMGYVIPDHFMFVVSDDHKQLLIYYRIATEKINQVSPSFLKMYDENLKETWTHKFETGTGLLGDDTFFQEEAINKVFCYNQSNGYATLGIMWMDIGASKPESVDFDLDFSEQSYVVQKIGDDKALVAGYYAAAPKAKNSAGYFTVLLDMKDHTMGKVNKYPFKSDVVNAFESDRTKRKLEKAIQKGAEPGIPSLKMDHIVKRSDGGYYLIGEQSYTKILEMEKGNKAYYYFQDAIISIINENGEEEKVLKLPKSQQFIENTYGSGLGVFEYNNSLYVFYLENSDNKDLREGEVPAEFHDFRSGCFMCVKIDPSGSMTRTSLFDIGDENKIILPDGMEQLEPGLLLSSGRRSRMRSGKVNTPALIRLK